MSELLNLFFASYLFSQQKKTPQDDSSSTVATETIV
ncbi:MAG: hypothetical protein QOH63_3025 [Acidobacteriota bacterium]|jgi:hypothetical protein|nr:hypothetical protein [Acidobacteriota bacterium]